MNHGSARTWVRTRRTAVLAALTLLVVGCGATGSPVDTTAAPTTTTRATTTGAGASATSTAPASTSVSPRGGLLATDPAHNAVQPFPAAGSCHARQAANGVLPDPTSTPGAVDPHLTDAGLVGVRHDKASGPAIPAKDGIQAGDLLVSAPPMKPSWPANAKQRHPAQHAATAAARAAGRAALHGDAHQQVRNILAQRARAAADRIRAERNARTEFITRRRGLR